MANSNSSFGGDIFTGVVSSLVFEAIKALWKEPSKKTSEELYIISYQAGLKAEEPRLIRYAETGDEVSLERSVFSQVLHLDLARDVAALPLSELISADFMRTLSNAMAKRW